MSEDPLASRAVAAFAAGEHGGFDFGGFQSSATNGRDRCSAPLV
jgi:hypothetical protein